MTAAAFIEDEKLTAERWKVLNGVGEAQVPWGAVALLDIDKREEWWEWLARYRFQRGKTTDPTTARGARICQGWLEVVRRARNIKPDLDGWIEQVRREYDPERPEFVGTVTQLVRNAALSSPRAFIDIIGLYDDEDLPIILKDFHVITVRSFRENDQVAGLLPYEYGKSYLVNILIPLMDWAEWPDAQEARVYFNETFSRKWIDRLMGEVEYNERLHTVFPWIRRPEKGDRSYNTWGVRGFAIGGRRNKDKSFHPLTVKTFNTGLRYHRVIIDDLVNNDNAKSLMWMDKFYDYLKAGVLTMRAKVMRRSRFGTKWGTLGVVGTVFDPNDVNYRIYKEWERQGKRVFRFDVYPRGLYGRARGEVLWPERRPIAHVLSQEADLGPKAFKMRCRNMIDDSSQRTFNEDEFDAACDEALVFGSPPSNCRITIGFDPGKGTRGRHSRNPAWVLYGEVVVQQTGQYPVTDVYLISWERMEGESFTRQCDKLIDLGRLYACPIFVEDNNIQTAYGEYVHKFAPDVDVRTHTTTENKRDPRDGVETFVPLFSSGLLHIHSGRAPGHALQALREEFTRWPGYRYNDLVMAAWVARYQTQLRRAIVEGRAPKPRPLPAYIRRFVRHDRRLEISGSKAWSTPPTSLPGS